MESVATIIGCVFGAHLLILVLWKHVFNRRHYMWVGRAPARVVLINKAANTRLGIDIAGDTVVTGETSSLLSTGDRIHLLNGKRLVGTSSVQSSELIRNISQLTLLVSAPLQPPPPSDDDGAPSKPRPRKYGIIAGLMGGGGVRTRVAPMPLDMATATPTTPPDVKTPVPLPPDVPFDSIAAIIQSVWRRHEVHKDQHERRDQEIASRVATKLQVRVG
jgi:hypothetical protein